MQPSSVRILNADASKLAATICGVEWSGIPCHLEDGAVAIDGDGEIPDAVREWISAGNTPSPCAPPVPTEADYSAAIQAHIEETARARGYRDAVTLASYVASTIASWAAEAQAFVAWRDAVWLYVYGELAKVQAKQRTQPSVAGLIDELIAEHQITWPVMA